MADLPRHSEISLIGTHLCGPLKHFAAGAANNSIGESSTSLGQLSTSQGAFSLAANIETTAVGIGSTALGKGTIAGEYASLAIGHYNVQTNYGVSICGESFSSNTSDVNERKFQKALQVVERIAAMGVTNTEELPYYKIS